ncbi:hypothetical protein ACFL17_09960 [Pseudomonadota bacterium]
MKHVLAILVACLIVSCGGGSSSGSSNAAQLAGVYRGTITSVGLARSSRILITVQSNGNVTVSVPAGIVCAGDLPTETTNLDGNSFDISGNGACAIGLQICPTNVVLTGAFFDGDKVSGSGQVMVGCPLNVVTRTFRFLAIKEP